MNRRANESRHGIASISDDHSGDDLGKTVLLKADEGSIEITGDVKGSLLDFLSPFNSSKMQDEY